MRQHIIKLGLHNNSASNTYLTSRFHQCLGINNTHIDSGHHLGLIKFHHQYQPRWYSSRSSSTSSNSITNKEQNEKQQKKRLDVAIVGPPNAGENMKKNAP